MAMDLVHLGPRRDISKMSVGPCGRGCHLMATRKWNRLGKRKGGEKGGKEGRRDRRQAPVWSAPSRKSSPHYFPRPANSKWTSPQGRLETLWFSFLPPPWLVQQLGEHLSLPGGYFLSSQQTNPTHKSSASPVSSNALPP